MAQRTDIAIKSRRLGIVSLPIFDTIEVSNYIVPHLHLGLGLSNNIFDKFNEQLVHRIEKISEEEKVIIQQHYTCKRVYYLYKIEHEKIKDHSDIDIWSYRMMLTEINNAIKVNNKGRN